MGFLLIGLIGGELKSDEGVVSFVRGRVDCLQFLLLNCKQPVTLLTEVKVEAVFALVPHSLDWHFRAAITFHIFLDALPWLYYQLNPMLICMTSHFQCMEWSCEVTVLTQTEVVAVCTHKASSNDRPHITTDTFVLVMSSKSIS
jgi:hypothetical protein